MSVYVDRDSNFKTTRHQGMEYRLKGVYPSTQFARALEELGIRMIYAYSPQAKGRIERKFGVFPRLWRGSELRLHNISTLEDANRYLWEKFIPQHNRMFSRTAKEPGSAYRPLPKGVSLKHVFCLKEERTVAGDNTISYQGKIFQILPNEYRLSFVKAKVKVHEHLDGSIHIFYQGKKLKHKQIPKERTKPKEEKLVAINY